MWRVVENSGLNGVVHGSLVWSFVYGGIVRSFVDNSRLNSVVHGGVVWSVV